MAYSVNDIVKAAEKVKDSIKNDREEKSREKSEELANKVLGVFGKKTK